ncbi:MAG TPA: hypothetical protein VIH42_04640 [Thermoguttaceae bacterium]
MPSKFQRAGISFLYPDNWTVDEEDAPAGQLSVTVYSPRGGFWSLAVHPGSPDPLKIANTALEAMKQEYSGIEVEEVNETLADWNLIGFDLNFFLLDFTNTAQIRSIRCDKTTYTVFCQAEDREFEQNQRVFQAMTISLLNGLKDFNY